MGQKLALFKSHTPLTGYSLKNGAVIYFRPMEQADGEVKGIYATSDPEEIAELTALCKSRQPNYYLDPDQLEIDSELMTPQQIMRHRIKEEMRQELLREMAANPNKDMGTYEPGPLMAANSHTIGGAAALSDSLAATNPANAAVSSAVKVSGIPVGTIKVASVAQPSA